MDPLAPNRLFLVWRKTPGQVFAARFLAADDMAHETGRRWAYRHVFGDYFDTNLRALAESGEGPARKVLDTFPDVRAAVALTLAWLLQLTLPQEDERVGVGANAKDEHEKNRIAIAAVLAIALRTDASIDPHLVNALEKHLYVGQHDGPRYPHLPSLPAARDLSSKFPAAWSHLQAAVLSIGSSSDSDASARTQEFSRLLFGSMRHYGVTSKTDHILVAPRNRKNWFNESAARTRSAQELAHAFVDAFFIDNGLGAQPPTRLLLKFPYETDIDIELEEPATSDNRTRHLISSRWLARLLNELRSGGFHELAPPLEELLRLVEHQYALAEAIDSKNSKRWLAAKTLLDDALGEYPGDDGWRETVLERALSLIVPGSGTINDNAMRLVELLSRTVDAPSVLLDAPDVSEPERHAAYLLARKAILEARSQGLEPQSAEEAS